MTDTPMPDWVLLEAAKRSGWSTELGLLHQQHYDNPVYAALCDMILKYERLRMHLDVALETLAEEGVCGDECNSCKEARAALGETK